MPRRIVDEPAFVLHQYDWSESSLILEVFTRHHGRVVLVAKGAKRPSSGFRPVLLPLQALRLSFGGDGEVMTLKAAEWGGGPVMPAGEALWQGWYLNELLLRLLARDDPHPALFDAYARAVSALARPAHDGADAGMRGAALRAFELALLRECGLLPALDRDTVTQQPLRTEAAYRLDATTGLVPVAAPAGPVPAGDGGPAAANAMAGRDWLALAAALDGRSDGEVSTVCAALPVPAQWALRSQLRSLLHYHCGTDALATPRVLLELQRA